MKNNRLKIGTLLVGMLAVLMAFTTINKTTYKFLIQMTNYEGEGAYVVVSLLNPKGVYEETLYVQGDDSEWYSDVYEWWSFYGKKRNNIDAITGATLSGGERKVNTISIDESKIDAGYTLRFESAVEDQPYHKDDVEIPLTSENLKGKIKGKGYIRYIRFLANK